MMGNKLRVNRGVERLYTRTVDIALYTMFSGEQGGIGLHHSASHPPAVA